MSFSYSFPGSLRICLLQGPGSLELHIGYGQAMPETVMDFAGDAVAFTGSRQFLRLQRISTQLCVGLAQFGRQVLHLVARLLRMDRQDCEDNGKKNREGKCQPCVRGELEPMPPQEAGNEDRQGNERD